MRHNLRNTFDTVLHQYMNVFRKPVINPATNKQLVKTVGGKAVAQWHYPNMPRITRSSLILIQTLTAGINTLAFPLLTTQTPLGATEVRLNLNDEFVITEMGLYLYGPTGTTTGPAGTLSNRYWTYSPMQLSNTFVGVQPFYDSGTFTLTIDQVQYVRAWDTNQHEVIPRTQDASYQAATAAIPQVNASLSSRMSHEDGFVEMTPTITLSGARTNNISINWPNGITPVANYEMLVASTDSGAASTLFFSINQAAVFFRGYLAQNAAKFQGSQEG
jgi:hypothetical protein